MYCSSNDEMWKLSQRHSELLDFARALEHRVTQLCQQPGNETELYKLRTIMCQSAFERLSLEKHIAKNNVQTVCQWTQLRQANRRLEQQNRDLLQRVLELEKYVKLQSSTVKRRLLDNDDDDKDDDSVDQRSRLSQLEKESARISGSHGELQRDVYELCKLVLDIASNTANHRDQARHDDDVDVATDRDGVQETSSPHATRHFVVRFNYDPFTMSPNADPESELSLRAGECVAVIGNVDDDGFYYGQTADDRYGLIPSNYLEKLPGSAVSNVDGLPSRSSAVPSRPSVLRLPTHRRTAPVAVSRTHQPAQPLTPSNFTRKQRARWRGAALTVEGPRKQTASPRTASRKTWQDINGNSTMRRSSDRQRLPGLHAQASAATVPDQRQNNIAQTGEDVGQRSDTHRLRDHWSLSSYSPDEGQVLATGEDKMVGHPVYRHRDIVRSTNSSAALTVDHSAAANQPGETAELPGKVRLRNDAAGQTRITDNEVGTNRGAQTSSDTTGRLQSRQTNGTSKWKNSTKMHASSQRRQPIHATNHVTSTGKTKNVLNRKRRDQAMMASSTDFTAVATSTGVAATHITQTPASRNGSFDVDSGTSKETTLFVAGQHTSSPAGTKTTNETKQGGGSGILARGQKLLKHLTNTNDRHGN